MDLLVRLYDLPAGNSPRADATAFHVRRAFAAEKAVVRRWIAQHFSEAWASESEVAFARSPIACFVAVEENELAGFACYDATARAFFGPFGVAETRRGRGVGRALLFATLRDMAGQGYGYAIVGAAGSQDFYRRNVDVMEIAGSAPGFYRGMLKQ
jgi:GNAT superfamily N-acetyltransferase